MQTTAEDLVGARTSGTSFVGRRDELGAVRTLLGVSRLVTIVGSGGSGKTRLAEEIIRRLARSLDGETGIAYLADATGPEEVIDLVAAAVGMRGRGDPHHALVGYLQGRRFLLVLDNCEHLQAPAASLARDLLAACPDVTILATSRRPLLVPGEQLFPIEGLRGDAAIALFTDRVRLASPSFVLPNDQRAIADDLCQRLDGMPLAIELAASRLRHLGLVELVARLSGRLADLGSDTSVAPERQRTLRGAIDWSHELLDEEARILWRRLCVFGGGFTLEAAEEVVAFPPLVRADVATLLGDLVDSSMVAFDLAHDRYRIIEAMREYGLEHLRASGEEARASAGLRAWMVGIADALDRGWWGPGQAAALDRVAEEIANLRTALEYSRADEAGDDGLRIATSSLWYWVTRASLGEAARWLEVFLERPSTPVRAARASTAAAWIAVLSGRLDPARELLERAADLAERSGDRSLPAYVRVVRCLALVFAQREGDALALAQATLADPDADAMCRCWALAQLGLVSFLRSDWEGCARASREGIAACTAVRESWTLELHLRGLAIATWQLGDPRAAASLLGEALRVDRQLEDMWHLAWTTEVLAWISVDLRRDERAARLLGIAEGAWEASGSGLAGPWLPYRERALRRLEARLGRQRLANELEAGSRLDSTRALVFALEDVQAEAASSVDRRGVSPRELEVAALVAEGLGNREIGERLFLSPRTVETHVQHLMNKLDVSSRAEIAAWHARKDSSASGS